MAPRYIMWTVASLPLLLMYGLHYVVHESTGSLPPGASSAPRFNAQPTDKDLSCCQDQLKLAHELSQLIQTNTVSEATAPDHLPLASAKEMKRAHKLLQKLYPKVHAAATRETVGGYSLLYSLKGSEPSLKPAMLLCHLDVSPIEQGSEASWTHAPFSGAVDGEFVWGRGAIDMKNGCAMIFHALEGLLARPTGFKPRRGLYVAIGHDEEVGGSLGAKAIAAMLAERGVEVEAVLDEGTGLVGQGVYPFIHKPVALVSTAEKGYMSMKISTTALGGGHSSRPHLSGTPISVLAEAASTLQRNQFSAKIAPPMSDFLDAAAKELVSDEWFMWPVRALAARWRWWRPVLTYFMEKDAQFNLFVRTTTALTIFQSGVKENVIPGSAHAVFNHRLMPGTSNATLDGHYRSLLAGKPVTHESTNAIPGGWVPASPVASVDSEGFRAVKAAVKETFGDDVPVLPFLLMAGADAKHYVALARGRVYRFCPLVLGPDELQLMHSTDERVSLEMLGFMCRFFTTFIKAMCL